MILGLFCGLNAEIKQDSYHQALHNSHEDQHNYNDINVGPNYPSGSGYDYQPQVKQQYGAPLGQYGPPSTGYGPPSGSYGPPISSGYGVPSGYGPPMNYGVPYNFSPEQWILNKLKLKLDLFTVGKILLKLIIFKKIVKFFALICLLLFLPKLQHHEEDNHGDGGEVKRNFQSKGKYNSFLCPFECMLYYFKNLNDSVCVCVSVWVLNWNICDLSSTKPSY